MTNGYLLDNSDVEHPQPCRKSCWTVLQQTNERVHVLCQVMVQRRGCWGGTGSGAMVTCSGQGRLLPWHLSQGTSRLRWRKPSWLSAGQDSRRRQWQGSACCSRSSGGAFGSTGGRVWLDGAERGEEWRQIWRAEDCVGVAAGSYLGWQELRIHSECDGMSLEDSELKEWHHVACILTELLWLVHGKLTTHSRVLFYPSVGKRGQWLDRKS